ncbi:MAG TPA: hypothetical protein VFC05_03455 [Nitrososphaeraceae archaeon]|jgi:hypothetical protein|nr:hypothetical protein [Nitrososphaeraceae archaeon]
MNNRLANNKFPIIKAKYKIAELIIIDSLESLSVLFRIGPCNFLYSLTSVYYLSYAATLLVIIGIVSILPSNIQYNRF